VLLHVVSPGAGKDQLLKGLCGAVITGLYLGKARKNRRLCNSCEILAQSLPAASISITPATPLTGLRAVAEHWSRRLLDPSRLRDLRPRVCDL
jgi:hypothetical protein